MASRTFVSFSSTDIYYFRLMQAWKGHDHIDFDFIDMQLNQSINSNNETYVKSLLRKKITNSGTFIQLIGNDTKSKHKYVRWETEVAIEKNCRIIGVNLNKKMQMNSDLTPPILKGIGAIFIPFNAQIIKYTLEHNWTMDQNDNRHWKNGVYDKLKIHYVGNKII